MREIVAQAHKILRKADTALHAAQEIDGVGVSTVQILEGLAMLAQEAAAGRAFGTDAATAVRRMISRSEAGARYYTAVDLLASKAELPIEAQEKVLEAALFANYGVYGSMTAFTPPVLLAAFLERGRFQDIDSIDDELDSILRSVPGFDRTDAHNPTYNVSAKHYLRILETAEQGGPGATLRGTLASAMRCASLLGSGARFKSVLGADAGKALPDADPYSFPPPFYVEGYPGRVDARHHPWPVSFTPWRGRPSPRHERRGPPRGSWTSSRRLTTPAMKSPIDSASSGRLAASGCPTTSR